MGAVTHFHSHTISLCGCTSKLHSRSRFWDRNAPYESCSCVEECDTIKRMYGKVESEKKKKKKGRLRRDSNPQSSDPKSDALSIRPRSQLNIQCLNKLLKSLQITIFQHNSCSQVLDQTTFTCIFILKDMNLS